MSCRYNDRQILGGVAKWLRPEICGERDTGLATVVVALVWISTRRWLRRGLDDANVSTKVD